MSDTRVDSAREARLEEHRRNDANRPKERTSEFDRILDQQIRQNVKPQAPQVSQLATEQAVREIRKEQQGGEERRRDDREEKRERQDSSPRGERSTTKAAEERVVAKENPKRDQQGGREGQGQHGFHGGTGRRGQVSTTKHGETKSGPLSLVGRFEQFLKASLKRAGESPALSQAILNKLVQAVKVGLNQKGEEEIEIQFGKAMFRGMKLRVTTRAGKVAVSFRVPDAEGRKTMESHCGKIQEHLASHGIEVDEIVVS